ncbi:ABC transporter permease [Bacteroidia bacterium]|nr:ABC transporter permease [Bacteroidia bacterium]
MIKHYLKVAFRNLRKYKSQTLISVVGLAVGFTCFALASLWIRYEMTFDDFHRDAGRMYCVNIPDVFSSTGMSRNTPYPLAGFLQATFPEITEAIAIVPGWPGDKIEIEGVEYPAEFVTVDSAFLHFFDVRIVEGNRDFLIPDSKKTAITQEKARQLFGKEDPMGKVIKRWSEECTICAVVTDLPKRSNYPFDFLGAFYSSVMETGKNWQFSGGENALIRLAPGVNVEAFRKKLNEYDLNQDDRKIKGITLTPLTQLRYTDVNIKREVKFQHILIFALAGSLLILCSLFNYLTLFLSRFRIRQKELALRTVCGASERSLFALLSVEFTLTLLFALLLGGVFIQLLHAPFQKLSEIRMELSAIYGESALYTGAVIALSLLVFWVILAIFRHRTLNTVIRHGNKNRFRKLSIVAQLFISIGFAFCTIVILKQMYFLHHTDLGFAFKNRGSVITSDKLDVLEDKIKQITEITETFQANIPLVPQNIRMSSGVSGWDEKPEGAEVVNIENIKVSEKYTSFYEFRLIEGEMLRDSDPDSLVLINESSVKAFGWSEPVGKKFNNRLTVKGVVKNIYNFAPTVSAKPVYYSHPQKNERLNSVLFKYREGTWKTGKTKIEEIIKELYPDNKYVSALNTEEEYDKFLTSENALLKILTFVSLVCVLICIFGFISLVSLTCEERRKEIAIRKINGATVRDILSIFIKEHFLLLLIGAAIAFPVGYYVMQIWLEQYVAQTAISLWVYLSILAALVAAIVLCVGWRVYQASVKNPAEEITKS